MQWATEICMPTTIHRYYIWHIMKKISHKLNGYKRHEEIEPEMSHVVWNSFTKMHLTEIEILFFMKYGVGGNKWLTAVLFELIDSSLKIVIYRFQFIWITTLGWDERHIKE
ncbi:hypothetical protein Ahy_B06g084522 isoform B [Arachis hypogaea]|uniref:Uncharacterized protein n=1 Tax=Arachis hypogaea TaxID=3818 RepID=A0A444YS60_ARAHY|nr:hypothetical protein Ahy_B06g084522 isoform B [Arachis hypogaea]